jgi:hypothetical protein
MLRTPEDIKQLLQQRKELNKRKKERELKRYRKAQEQTKKQLKHKASINIKQTPEKPLKYTYSLTIYQSPLIERFPDEEDLYHTREEIDNDDSGSINWEVLDKIIERLRKNL